MFRALYTAATGMVAQQLNLDNVANNLSNASTSGFRRRRLQFQDLMYQNLVMPGAAATQNTTVAVSLQVGLGTRTVASEVIQTQGDFTSTGNSLDLAIQGTGFFQLKMPDGDTGYTRGGIFHLDTQGNMVTSDGNPLDPPITIPTMRLTISVGFDGTVTRDPTGTDPGAAGWANSVGNFSESGRIEQRGQQRFSCRRPLREIRLSELPAERKAWGRCNKGCWSNRT